jgi:hypothetical protein
MTSVPLVVQALRNFPTVTGGVSEGADSHAPLFVCRALRSLTPRFSSSSHTASTSSTQMLSWKREPASGPATTPGSTSAEASET